MIRISKNTPLSKKDLIELLNKILEKDEPWSRYTTIGFIKIIKDDLFNDVDKLLREQRNLALENPDEFRRWKEIQGEVENIYKTIDKLGECWKYEKRT